MNIDTLLRRASIRGHELRSGIDAFAHHLCAALSLRPIKVRWSSGMSTAAINAYGDLILSDVADDTVVTRATVLRYAGFVLHELLHRKYTDFGASRIADSHLERQLFNAVEDAWIEHRAIASSLVGNAAGLLSALVETIVAESLANVDDWGNPAQHPFALAIFLRDHAQTKVPLASGLLPIFTEARARLAGSKCSMDNLNIARWVLAQLDTLPEGEQGDEPQGDGRPCPEGQDGEQGEQSTQPGGEGEGEGEGEGNGAPQDGPSDAPESSTRADQGEGEGEVAPQKKNAPKARRPANLDDAAEVEPTLPSDTNAPGANTSPHSIYKDGAHARLAPAMIPQGNAPARLRAEVRRLFDNSDHSAFDLNRRAGSLNTGALPKVSMGGDRVFKRRDDAEGIDSAVVIVFDVSSSMWDDDDTYPLTVQTCDALVDSLKSAGVEVAVVSFGDSISTLVDFGAPAARIKTMTRRLASAGSTNDFEAVRHAHGMLLRRPERRKVCIVLTDGDGHGYAVKRQCLSGQTLGITTIGIGIGKHNKVNQWYTNPVKVVNLSDLATTALSQIKVAA